MDNTLENDLDVIAKEALVREGAVRGIEFELQRQRRDALSRQDAVRYSTLCQQLGIDNPEDAFLYELGVLEMNRSLPKQQPIVVSSELFSRKRPAVDYKTFLDMTEQFEVNVNNIFRDTSSKRLILRKSGYSQAYVGKGRKIPLSDVSDARIGKMFVSVYNQAKKSS